MNRTDLQELAELRIDEAQALLMLTPPRPDGAYYLAGYAVECALKAVIAKKFNHHEWPEKAFVNQVHTHDLKTLFRSAELEVERDAEMIANPRFAGFWKAVSLWNEGSRCRRHTSARARMLIEAVNDPTDGVLKWIRARW